MVPVPTYCQPLCKVNTGDSKMEMVFLTQILLVSRSFHSTESLWQSNLRRVSFFHISQREVSAPSSCSPSCVTELQRRQPVHPGIMFCRGTDLPVLPLQCCTPALSFSDIWQPGYLKILKQRVSWIYS